MMMIVSVAFHLFVPIVHAVDPPTPKRRKGYKVFEGHVGPLTPAAHV